MNFEWHLSSPQFDERRSVPLSAAVAKLKRVPLPREWKESSDAGTRWEKTLSFSKSKGELRDRLSKFTTLMNHPDNVKQDLAGCCSYVPPLVGNFECAILVSSETSLHPKAEVDLEWKFAYERRGEHPSTIKAARTQTRQAERFARSCPAKIPRVVVNASLVALFMERLPLNVEAAAFLKTCVETYGPKPTILAIGLPKPLSELPPVVRLVQDCEAKKKKTAISVKEYLLLAHVHDDIYMTHPASVQTVWRRHSRRPDVTGCPYFKNKLQPRDVEALSLHAAAAADEPKRRKLAIAAIENDTREDEAGRFPTRLEDVNATDGDHRGLRDVIAVARAMAEITNANREKRRLCMQKALELVECDPNRWDEDARSRKWLFFWKTNQNQYHADLAYVEKMIGNMKNSPA